MRKKDFQELQDLMHEQYRTTIEAHAAGWIGNLARNYRYVHNKLSDFRTGRAETCLIFAPGASLTQYADKIKRLKNEDRYIVGTPTVLPWMMRNGLEPDVVVAVDRNDEMHKWLKLSRWRGPVILPSIGNNLLAKEYPCWWFNIRLSKPGYVPWIDAVVETQYPDLPALPSLGHVTGHALQIMYYLTKAGGAAFRRFVLVGADYGYWQGMSRVRLDGAHVTESIQENELVTIDGVQTNYKMALYKARLLELWRANLMPLYSMSEGLLHEIPYVSFGDILAGRYPPSLPSDQIAAAHDKYVLKTIPSVLIPELKIAPPSVWSRFRTALSGRDTVQQAG